MGTLTRSHTFVAGETPTAAEFNVDIDNLLNEINGELDADNVDTSSADGIMSLNGAQTVTGVKTFNSMKLGDIVETTNGGGGLQALGALRYDPADENIADNDGFYLSLTADNDASTPEEIEYGRISLFARDVSDSTEDGEIQFSVMQNGTLTAHLGITNAFVYPLVDSAINLGSTTARWFAVYTDSIGDSGQNLECAATTFKFSGAGTQTIQTTSNVNLNLDVGTGIVGVLATTGVNIVGNTLASQSASTSQTVNLGRTDTPGGAQTLCTMNFTGDDDGGNATNYVALVAKSTTVTDTSEDGQLEFYTTRSATGTLKMTIAGDITIGSGGALATSANAGAGHAIIPTCAGTPTGTATNGSIIIDTSNNKCYVYSGSWVALN